MTSGVLTVSDFPHYFEIFSICNVIEARLPDHCRAEVTTTYVDVIASILPHRYLIEPMRNYYQIFDTTS